MASGGDAGSRDWMSYDSVAATYAEVAAPWFAPIARDLVAALAPVAGETFLDLGTGTGLVAELAYAQVQPGGVVVAVDPSTGMLARVERSPSLFLVAGRAPGLPVGAQRADLAGGNLVLSHLPDLASGMADIVRVLRVGGRFGATAWAPPVPAGPDHDRPEADTIVAEAKNNCGLNVGPPPDEAVPFEEVLRDEERLVGLIEDAGLVDVSTALHRYEKRFTVSEFLSGWGSQGRYLRHVVGERRWRDFVEEAASALREKFGDGISCVNDVWIVVGRRP